MSEEVKRSSVVTSSSSVDATWSTLASVHEDKINHLLNSYPQLLSILTLMQSQTNATATSEQIVQRTKSVEYDTHRLAGCLLFLQLVQVTRQEQQEAIAMQNSIPGAAKIPTPSSTAPLPRAAVTSSISAQSTKPPELLHPFYDLFPRIYEYVICDGFLERLLLATKHQVPIHMVSTKPPQPSISSTPTEGLTTYAQVGLRLLRELTAHPLVTQQIGSSSSVLRPVFLMLLDSSSDNCDARLLLTVLNRVRLSGIQRSSKNPTPTASASLTINEIQQLVGLVSQLTQRQPVDLSIMTTQLLQCIHWQIGLLFNNSSAGFSSSNDILANEAINLLPPLSQFFQNNQTAAKFDCLRLLLLIYAHVPSLVTEAEVNSSTHSFASFIIGIRTGLSTLLGNKLEPTATLDTLRLSRLLLQRYGPLFATTPSNETPASTSSATSKPPRDPHTQFLTLLTNIFTIELRLNLDELASTRASDIERVAHAGDLKEQLAMESVSLFQCLLENLLGEDDEVAEETQPFQWWNLSSTMIMHFKKRLDECSEALVIFFRELHHHPHHPRSPQLVWSCGQAFARWLTEEVTEEPSAEVVELLPFLCQIQVPKSMPPNTPSFLNHLIPVLLPLSTKSTASAVLIRENLIPRLIREVILPLFDTDIQTQVDLLQSMNQLDRDRMEADVAASDMHSILLTQLRNGLATISSACETVHNLITASSSSLSSAIQTQLRSLHNDWSHIQTAIQTSLTGCHLLTGVSEEEGVNEIRSHLQTLLQLLTNRIGPPKDLTREGIEPNPGPSSIQESMVNSSLVTCSSGEMPSSWCEVNLDLIELIAQFLIEPDLIAWHTTCWSYASMAQKIRSPHLSTWCDPFDEVPPTLILRHIRNLVLSVVVTTQISGMIQQQIPKLKCLTCTLQTTEPGEPHRFPPNLEQLAVKLILQTPTGHVPSTSQQCWNYIQRWMDDITTDLPRLHWLDVSIIGPTDESSGEKLVPRCADGSVITADKMPLSIFESLKKLAPHLTSLLFNVSYVPGELGMYSREVLDQIRCLDQLTCLNFHGGSLETIEFDRLFREPIPFKLKTFKFDVITVLDVPIIGRLTSLSQCNNLHIESSDLTFLTGMTELESLGLEYQPPDDLALEVEQQGQFNLIGSIAPQIYTSLMHLSLVGINQTADEFDHLASSFKKLKSLRLGELDELTHLRWLSHLSATLEILIIFACSSIEICSLRYLRHMTALTELTIEDSFVENLDGYSIASLTPGSDCFIEPFYPALKSFLYSTV